MSGELRRVGILIPALYKDSKCIFQSLLFISTTAFLGITKSAKFEVDGELRLMKHVYM
ncbi:hypothetical protein FD15_GL001289 [Liquorilactobacillus sucicola DSM 21376 = JCM 15457]|uniref:Uncharacterized protein n=1 Tax=Liquorilactobacillus sucicola DSM 21376 = JCM 15457 TaxID=1423806 RepID=A0A0R2DPV1_9LACO|nr:hypothetical protein FD15_GL001289 [Liquorilactobacillus sucicola DSM 21376 = JCM 15457]